MERGTMIWGDEDGANSVSTSRAGECEECGESTEAGDPVTDCQAEKLGLSGSARASSMAMAESNGSIIWGDEPGANSVPTSRASECAEACPNDSANAGDEVTECQKTALGL